jgi:spore photoproduct lyase
MRDLNSKFDRIFIHHSSAGSKLAQRALEIFPADKIAWVDRRPYSESTGDLSAREFARSKRLLYLEPFKGHFFKRCPGSRPGLACCNYFVLNWGQQCDMNCSYCYLQSFINSPVLTIYTNLDAALQELRELNMADQALRIGTGETVDSLSLDDFTLFSHELIGFFRDYPKWTLEFKTKSAKVEQFLDIPHKNNVVVSWSINPQNVIAKEEHLTASLQERLAAAEKCLQRGFKIAFHIDPMIYHPEWEKNYSILVHEICQRFRPEDIPYLSVGALRFQPEQKSIMRERFGLDSWVTRAEVFPSQDGKLRYDAELRQKMFNYVMGCFKQDSPAWRIFMCMETPETWLKTVGTSPFRILNNHELFNTSAPMRVRKLREQV